jgi:hypothetical protein
MATPFLPKKPVEAPPIVEANQQPPQASRSVKQEAVELSIVVRNRRRIVPAISSKTSGRDSILPIFTVHIQFAASSDEFDQNGGRVPRR